MRSLRPFAPSFVVLAVVLPAQGGFVNYEDPQVKPIAVASVGSFDYVLACNTPDNSIEVYKAEWNLQAPIARVPVGLSPVTVKWNASTGHFFSCNYLGDSVTRVRLDLVPATSTTPETVSAVLEQTENVGNEPTDIAFEPSGGTALVTLHAQGSLRRIQCSTLAAVTGALPLAATPPSHVAQRLVAFGAPTFTPPAPPTFLPLWLVKQSRRVEVLSDTRTYVLNTMGGELSTRSPYDMGIWASVPASGGGTSLHAVSDVGSTNLGFAINAAGDRMFVVSQIAQNFGNLGIGPVSSEPTGFVQTWLKIVTLPSNGNAPTVVGEQIAGSGTKPTFQSVDLNRDYSQTSVQAVAAASRLAQVTDVILIPDPVSPSDPEHVVLAGFGSEKVTILKADPNAPNGYAMTFVTIPPLSTGSYSAVGPRALAYSADATQPSSGTAPGLVFVLNRLDNSLAVVNPWNSNVTRRGMANDPTPLSIRAGRKFLYTAAATSGNQLVSCSSCHVDARTDGLRWRLGDLHAGAEIPVWLVDGFDTTLLTENMGTEEPEFPVDKPEIVTQTLQGLVNYHIEPEAMQFMATNAPYHWRGDKERFQDFNEAFVNLQGLTALSGSGPTAKGIADADMDAYTSFVNTIHHPPNPEQRLDRTYGGDTGDPDAVDDGAGGLWGRKLFHTFPALEGRSCVHCHALPEGSSNTLTELNIVSTANSSTGSSGGYHPFEAAALRNVVAREMLLPDPTFTHSAQAPLFLWPVNGASGLLHGGANSVGGLPPMGSMSINDFAHHVFVNLTLAVSAAATSAVVQFVRELDTGTAPLVGSAWTVTAATVSDPRFAAAFTLAVGQAAEANVGVAAYLRVGGVERGMWYDVHGQIFREENGSTALTDAQMMAALSATDDVLIVQVTPAGSERRVASLTGSPVVLSGQPSNVTLLPMVPNTAFEGISDFDANIDPNHAPFPFVFTPAFSGATEPLSLKMQRTFATAVSGSFGVPGIRHEPPRRFRVAGNGIVNGAQLGLESTLVPNVVVWFDLTPTTHTGGGSLPVWETTEELDPLQTLALLCGGYSAPGVLDVLLGIIPPTTALSPATANGYYIHVRNENTQSGTVGPVALTIGDTR